MHILLHRRPKKEFVPFAEAERLVKAVADSAGVLEGTNLATRQGLFARAEDEVQTARLTAALDETFAAMAKRRAVDAGARRVNARTGFGDRAAAMLDVAPAADASTS